MFLVVLVLEAHLREEMPNKYCAGSLTSSNALLLFVLSLPLTLTDLDHLIMYDRLQYSWYCIITPALMP